MKEYIERESLIKIFTTNEKVDKVSLSFVRAVIKNAAPAADVIEADRLGRVGRLMLPIDVSDFGDTVFLTREAAEKALEEV